MSEDTDGQAQAVEQAIRFDAYHKLCRLAGGEFVPGARTHQ